ncbi:MAG: glucosidase [Chlorobi bacterium CHB2]|nr:glucosidase [Chlorobi bacterium CHB2]
MTIEEQRLNESTERSRHWKRWGPYLSERAWGTVREDYSPNGEPWEYFPFDHARYRAYRWNEDGIGGICDRHQFICFALTLWNGRDPFLKERLFGLNGKEGNHGEDVKEHYFFLDSTPTHSSMRFLYKYPHAEFPYQRLLEENRRRGKADPEFELDDTGIFDEDRYFDVEIEYAKADVEDILISITATNRGPDPATLHLLPTIWFRNTWTWGRDTWEKPRLHAVPNAACPIIQLHHHYYQQRRLYCEGNPMLLFTENNTNNRRLYNAPNSTPFVKDSINEYLVRGNGGAVNPDHEGTKASAHYRIRLEPGEGRTIRLRLTDRDYGVERVRAFGREFSQVMARRRAEADEFYHTIIPHNLSDDARNVMRQAFAGLLWTKQYYHYVISEWVEGDPALPPPPAERHNGRNSDWPHLYNSDVISMPDAWEYPWYAAWDLAFHCIPLALVDPEFAKQQLILFLREWYMHPNGQIPAYEWKLGDVNPPVHAWAALRVYRIEKKRKGKGDRVFLERVFQKLLLNFTWWVNRKDAEGNNIFEGGFLGLDNIGVFDRSAPLPTGGQLEQSDGTSWMAMYTLNMMAIALELAHQNPAYEDLATKFWEHFLYISHAMNIRGNDGLDMWDEEDGFYYDIIHLPHGFFPVRIRSMVGLISLFAVETIEPALLEKLPGFRRRMEWFLENRPDLLSGIAQMNAPGTGQRRLMALANEERLRSILKYMLDENEFLSEHGIRSLSRHHRQHPYRLQVEGMEYRVDYEPAESQTGMFGGNSNWRGPVWFPVNFLIIESLQKFHHYYGDDFTVEFPTGSGTMLNLWEVAMELERRLAGLFLRGDEGRRPANGGNPRLDTDPNWRDLVLFHEYFHGDTGAGLGASHQTGWTALVAKIIQQMGEMKREETKG